MTPRRRSWWRRNRWGLVAFVVLAPLTVGVTFANEWGGYYAQRPSQPVEVDAGSTSDFGGSSWTLTDSERIAGDSDAGREAGLPEGTDLVVATIAVEPKQLDEEGRSAGCSVLLDERASGGEVLRTWGDAQFASIDYDVDPGHESFCDPDLTDPYTFESTFIVPSGAGVDLSVQVEVVSELPRYLRMDLG